MVTRLKLFKMKKLLGATPGHFSKSGSARGGSGIPIYPKKNRQNTPKYPKFLQIYPKIIEALNTLYPKLEVSETNTYLVVLPFLASPFTYLRFKKSVQKLHRLLNR